MNIKNEEDGCSPPAVTAVSNVDEDSYPTSGHLHQPCLECLQ